MSGKATVTFFDIGLVSKWLNGLARPSADNARFYQQGEQETTLADVALTMERLHFRQ